MDQKTGSAWLHTALPLKPPLVTPPPALSLLSSALLGSCCSCLYFAKVISLLPNGSPHHPKRGCQPPPPPTQPFSLVSLKPPFQGDSFLIHTCDDSNSASEQASAGAIQTASQLCFSHGSGTSQQIRARFSLGFSPPWRQQGYPGNRLLHSVLLWKRLLWRNQRGGIRQLAAARPGGLRVGAGV